MSIEPFRHECIILLRTRGVVDLREEGREFGWISLFGGVNNGVLEIVLEVVGNVTPNRRRGDCAGLVCGIVGVENFTLGMDASVRTACAPIHRFAQYS